MVYRVSLYTFVMAGTLLCTPVVLSQSTFPNAPTLPGYEPGQLAPLAQPGVAQFGNQQMADAIAAHLRHSPVLHSYRVNISYAGGVVRLSGQVADSAQLGEVERLVRAYPGVVRVENQIQVPFPNLIQQTQILNPPNVDGGAQPGGPPPPAPSAGPQEPTPIFQAPPHGVPNAYNPPRMPPYAWPTYAPYNNYSRVAYPTIYPAKSWPFIGPIHPFPKVPLGWRSVSLTWQDGFWWYGRNATGHNWWKVRFW